MNLVKACIRRDCYIYGMCNLRTLCQVYVVEAVYIRITRAKIEEK